MHHRNPSTERGVTLIELVFTVAIFAIVCATALPAFGNLMANNRSRNAHNALVAALNLARSTAAMRQVEVGVCPSTDGAYCADSIWWQGGWIVFADSNRDGKRDPDENLIQVAQRQAAIAIASSVGRKHIGFRPDGSATGSNLTLTICDRRGSQGANTVVVNNAGRIRTGRASAGQSAAACSGVKMP
jgi:type IV fimbrial biogenesis protein FimT